MEDAARPRSRKDELKNRSDQKKDVPEHLAARPLYILVVEDHADSRRMLELFLHALGYKVESARNIQEAFDLLVARGKRFDLLLSDMRLPDGDGWDLMRRLEEAGCRPAQAIALSGWGSSDDIIKSRKACFQAHLVKPAAPQALRTALKAAAEAIQAAKTE
jgi:two-component system response regulator PilR (NtrC family)